MLNTIVILLIVLWLLGLLTSTSMGGLIHILLVVAIIIVLVRVKFKVGVFSKYSDLRDPGPSKPDPLGSRHFFRVGYSYGDGPAAGSG